MSVVYSPAMPNYAKGREDEQLTPTEASEMTTYSTGYADGYNEGFNDGTAGGSKAAWDKIKSYISATRADAYAKGRDTLMTSIMDYFTVCESIGRTATLEGFEGFLITEPLRSKWRVIVDGIKESIS